MKSFLAFPFFLSRHQAAISNSPLVLGERQKKQLLQGSFREAELVFTRGKWLFNLVIEIPNAEPSLRNGVMGIDLGENNLYATNTGKISKGKTLRDKRDRYLALRRHNIVKHLNIKRLKHNFVIRRSEKVGLFPF